MRARWAIGLVAIATLLFSGAASTAVATAPVTLGSSRVLDDTGELTSTQLADAEKRLGEFSDETTMDLWVVFVDRFTDPTSPEDWANQVAKDNGLGPNQYLLAVAVDGRTFYLSGDSAGPVTDAQLNTIEQQKIQPRLVSQDWVGAVDGAADGLTEAVGATHSESSGGGILTVVLIIAALLAIAAVVFVLLRNRRKKSGAVAAGSDAAPPVETAELARQASSALVATDDAVRTSEQELGFAKAQFGDVATAEFEQALAAAKTNLADAFTLKQQLDDETPDGEQQVREWNSRIIQLLQAANAGLDEKAAAFDELRKLEQNAPESLARVQGERAAAGQAIDAAAQHLQTLQTSYAPAALATVVDNVDQARQRLAFADQQLTAAQAALGGGDGGQAAVGIRAAEGAVAQAKLLEDAIDTLGADLDAGVTHAGALITDLEGDIAAASALPDPDGQLAAVVAATRQQVDAAKTNLAGTAKTPAAVLTALESANQQIDGTLQGVRDATAQAQRAQQLLGQTMMQAQAQVSAAEDYVTARRGAIGAEARTRLAEAGAALVQAQQLQATDPAQALQYAQRANQLAAQSIQSAQNDVGGFSGGGMLGGGLGGGGNGNGMLGAVLGGIVINSLLSGGGSRGGSRGGGGLFGGGGSRGGGGGISPGSFGGGGTRSRRGGGRF